MTGPAAEPSAPPLTPPGRPAPSRMRVLSRVLLGLVVSALLPAGVLLGRHLQRPPACPPSPRLTLAADLPEGTVLKLEHLSERSVPCDAPGLSSDRASQLVGRALVHPGLAGDALTWADVREALGERVMKKARAVPIDFDAASAVGRGDHLDVLAVLGTGETAYATTLIQNVIVVAAEPLGARRRLWLLLIPEEAEQLALAQLQGHLSLSVRNPDDVDVLEPRALTTAAELRDHALPEPHGCHHQTIQLIRKTP